MHACIASNPSSHFLIPIFFSSFLLYHTYKKQTESQGGGREGKKVRSKNHNAIYPLFLTLICVFFFYLALFFDKGIIGEKRGGTTNKVHNDNDFACIQMGKHKKWMHKECGQGKNANRVKEEGVDGSLSSSCTIPPSPFVLVVSACPSQGRNGGDPNKKHHEQPSLHQLHR